MKSPLTAFVGMATAIGLVLGLSMFILGQSARAAEETAVIVLMRQLLVAQTTYYGTYSQFAGHPRELLREGLISNKVTDDGMYLGYRIEMTVPNGRRWASAAHPVTGGQWARYFYMDDAGVVRSERGKPATEASQPLN
ncbi:MAG: hypothetical protein HY652_08240 [Acidobacteria bacterium]|nr:hypothetical protein [Acidobacteriota bacterium]